MNKKIFVITLFACLAILFLLAQSLAITAYIGNSRMVLRTEPNKTVEKNILVRNLNEIPVNVSLTVTGELADYVTLSKDFLTLMPNESEKINFTIFSPFVGISETKINVLFSNGDEEVGLSSTITLITNTVITNQTKKSCERECKKLCANLYTADIKSCNINYSSSIKLCNNERKIEQENCTGLKGKERKDCINNTNKENRECKKEALEKKTDCKYNARINLELCRNAF